MEEEVLNNGLSGTTEQGWNNGLSGGDIAAVVLYFILVLGIGLYSMMRPNRDTIEGYFLAGKHMFWLPVGASLFASNIGSEHFIGLAGTGAASGLGVAAFEFNALILLQLLGFVFIPVFIASKVRTLPEYMVKRFGGRRISMYLAVLSMILYIFTKISVNLYSGAIFIQQAIQWNIYISIVALLLLTLLCTAGGGLAAVIYIDVVQVLIMVGGSSCLLFLGLDKVGGWESLKSKYMTAVANVTYYGPDNSTCGLPREDAWQVLREARHSDMPWPGFLLGQTPASIWYWCADQMMVQKALSAKSLSDAQGATILTGWIKVLPMFLIVVPGMISRVLYPDTVGCVDPAICEAVCGNPVSCSNTAFPALVLGIMPEGLRGVMLAVMLAALMSDLTSIFNSASTLFTMDIYREMRSSASTKELLIVGRVFLLFLVAISIAWIPIIQTMQGGQLFIYIQAISAYLSPPIAIVYLMAILSTRINEKGAFFGLMYGLCVGLARMALDFSYKAPLCMETDDRPWVVASVHYMYFAAGLFITTGLVTIVVSLCTDPPREYNIVRTTFMTRHDQRVRKDELEEVYGVELDPLTGNGSSNGLVSPQHNPSDDESPTSNCCLRFLNWVLGVESDAEDAEKNQKAMAEHLQQLSTLQQSTFQRVILYTNLAIILSLAVFLYVFFSINPFSAEELGQFRSEAINKTSLRFYEL